MCGSVQAHNFRLPDCVACRGRGPSCPMLNRFQVHFRPVCMTCFEAASALMRLNTEALQVLDEQKRNGQA